MEKDKLQRTVTTIVGSETSQMSNGGFMSKVKAADGHNYVVFHLKKDKTESMAYKALKNMPMSGIGKVVEIIFKEETFEKEGKTFKSRKAVGFSEPSTEPIKKEELIKAESLGEEVTDEIQLAKLSFND